MKASMMKSHPRRLSGYQPGRCNIFSENLLQELKSPRELILIEPVPEVVEFRPADWAE